MHPWMHEGTCAATTVAVELHAHEHESSKKSLGTFPTEIFSTSKRKDSPSTIGADDLSSLVSPPERGEGKKGSEERVKEDS